MLGTLIFSTVVALAVMYGVLWLIARLSPTGRQSRERRRQMNAEHAQHQQQQEARERERIQAKAKAHAERTRPRPLEIGPENNQVHERAPALPRSDPTVRAVRAKRVARGSAHSSGGNATDKLRVAFYETLAEITPTPSNVAALFKAAKRSFAGETRAPEKAAAKLVSQATYWPELDRRIAELEAAGVDASRLSKVPIGELLIRRAVMMTFARQRSEDMLNNAAERSQWQFESVADSMNPSECAAKHRSIHPAGSAFFDDGPPCWRPDCRCRIRALSNRR